MADHVISLDAKQEKALTQATDVHNRQSGTNLTPSEYFQLRASNYLDSLVARYRERIMNKMAENFDQLTPQEQAAILQQLNITL